MSDTFTPEQRSEIMRKVKSRRNRSTELKLIEFFKSHGIKGWRRNYPLPGKPDFVFPKQRIAVFADGCFWHGHDCRNTKPAQNKSYWDAKRARNQERDRLITELLTKKGWKVVRVWECEVKKQALIEKFRFLFPS